jgi:hypothetical protein
VAARIVSVADVYEVMTAPRAYKRSMSVAAARRELVRVAGTQLDPVIVRAFLNVSVGRLWRTVGFGAWIAQIPQLGRLVGAGGFTSSGMGMGIATATTATVLAVSGVTGAAPAPVVPSPAALSPAVALAPSHAEASRTPQATTRPRRPSITAAARPAPSSTGGMTPASATAVSGQSPPGPIASSTPASAKATAAPVPAATSKPTPAPTPDPWSCAQCTNTLATCTSYCTNANAVLCTTYCQGNNNTTCVSHCFGANNRTCVTYCQGTNNKTCQSLCRTSAVVASMTTPLPRRQALSALAVGWTAPPLPAAAALL